MSIQADGFDGLSLQLDALAANLVDAKLLNRLGLGAIRFIQVRTREGKDLHGAPFAPYSAPYAKLKTAAGLKTSPVTLSFGVKKIKNEDETYRIEANLHDTMMTHLDHVVSRDLAAVAVIVNREDKETLMRYHSIDGAGKGKVIREAWGLSGDEKAQLVKLVGEDLAAKLSLTNPAAPAS